ncbi:MAG: DUF1461 domain-containing protein, partial [Candidatus Aenigmarchaeota archaeon]|nr:DUF1461 domain-containing protein [Candidatus Aenigmarchaeota archaeon]
MDPKKAAISVSKILIVLAMPFALFSNNIQLLANPYYLRWENSKDVFSGSSLFTSEEKMVYSEKVLDYVSNRTDISTLENMEIFTGKEIDHLKDVKEMNERLNFVQKFSLLAVVYLLLFVVLVDKNRWCIVNYINIGSLITILIVLFLLLFIFLKFDLLFESLHTLLFQKGTWVFSEDSSLIQLYPRKFWVDSGSYL